MVKLDSLTSLRFFAALGVVMYHARDQFNCLWDLPRSIVFSQGVTFFFVLSGFILAYVYPNLSGKQEIGAYVVKRIGRIWPLHALCLIAVVLLLPPSLQLEPTRFPAPYTLIFLTNLFMVQSWILGDEFFFSFNPPAWSISNELFFYLALPLILMPLNKKEIAIKLIPLAVCFLIVLSLINFANALSLPLTSSDMVSLQALLGVNPLVRIFDFCLGVSTGFLFSKYKHTLKEKLTSSTATILEIAALLAVLCAIWNTSRIADLAKNVSIISNAGSYWLRESGLVILFFAALIFILALERGYLSKVLSAPPLVLLGDISFAIYLCHFPLLKIFYVYIPHERSFKAFCLYLAILFCLSFLLFRLWEQPWRNLFTSYANKEKIVFKKPKIEAGTFFALSLLALCSFFVKENIDTLNEAGFNAFKNQKSFLVNDKTFGADLKFDGYSTADTAFGKRLCFLWSSSNNLDTDQSLLVQLINEREQLFHQQQLRLCPDSKTKSKKVNDWILPVELPESAYKEAVKMTLKTNNSEQTFILAH